METITDKLIELFGNQHKTAKALGVDAMTVHHWVKQGYIPFHRGNLIEEKSKGYIKASEVWECAAKARHHGNIGD